MPGECEASTVECDATPRTEPAGLSEFDTVQKNHFTNLRRFHNYKLSPKKEWYAQPNTKSGEVVVTNIKGQKISIPKVQSGEYYWGPEGRRIAFLGPGQYKGRWVYTSVKIADLKDRKKFKRQNEKTGEEEEWYEAGVKTVYESSGVLRGLEWSPDGKYLFFLEDLEDDQGFFTYLLKKVSVSGRVETLVKGELFIDFFMPPVTFFEYGQGKSNKPYEVMFGREDGVFTISPDGGKPTKIVDYPGEGVDNSEWSPDGDWLAMHFRWPRLVKGVDWAGLYLINMADGKYTHHRLYPNTDVHTLWFSPKSNWVSYATPRALYLVHTGTMKKVKYDFEDITGFYWRGDEKEIMITGGTKIYTLPISEVASSQEENQPELLFQITGEDYRFIADPHYVGKRVSFTVYEDVKKRAKHMREKEEKEGEEKEE